MGDKVGNKAGDKASSGYSLNETQKKILEVVRNNPNVTKKQIQDKIGKGKTTVDNGIAFLKDYGFIIRVGSNKTGFWKVIDI